MIEVDRLMTDEYGITLIQMMENAGRNLAEVARHLLGGSLAQRRVVVLVGKGNNGGGGLVASRHLVNAGASVAVALSHAPGELTEVSEQQRRVLAKTGVEGAGRPTSANEVVSLLGGAELVVDALIGYSLRGAPRKPASDFIIAANREADRSGTAILSLDIPSGLDGDNGHPCEPCIRASATVTLAWPKAGLLRPGARAHVGDLYLADIGVPAAVYRAVGAEPGELFSSGPIVRVRVSAEGWQPMRES
ncbi:MAG TPA: NAD(P)H-hydrate epimerase [Chloroflexia bacterium]|nr:NAD(P)H-hydrate epimerase [Chloroflexia bacterium]